MKSTAQIAAALPGYNPQHLPVAVAQKFIAQLAEQAASCINDTEQVPLLQAVNRVLACDVLSPIDVPPQHNSAMDGYAFNSKELSINEGQQPKTLTLQVIGSALAGKLWTGEVKAGECIKIMTGATLPDGLDTVVAHEQVSVQASSIRFDASAVRAGSHCRLRGEELRRGAKSLSKGELLAQTHIGFLAGLGIQTVTVVRCLRVAYFSSGDEVLPPGAPLRAGAVYDSNRFSLLSLLSALPCEAIDLGTVPDDPAQIQTALKQAAAQADVIISSGGVSAGDADFSRSAMQHLGDVQHWQLAMRPGRPMAVGQIFYTKQAAGPGEICASSYKINSKPVLLFGLPGNPVATLVNFLILVRPALLRLAGATPRAPLRLKAISPEALRKKPGRTEYARAVVSSAPNGQLQVRLTGRQSSAFLSSMVQANALIVLSHDQGDVPAGEWVDVILLSELI
jgi:molybdopterin molybdotransferase